MYSVSSMETYCRTGEKLKAFDKSCVRAYTCSSNGAHFVQVRFSRTAIFPERGFSLYFSGRGPFISRGKPYIGTCFLFLIYFSLQKNTTFFVLSRPRTAAVDRFAGNPITRAFPLGRAHGVMAGYLYPCAAPKTEINSLYRKSIRA